MSQKEINSYINSSKRIKILRQFYYKVKMIVKTFCNNFKYILFTSIFF